MLAGRFTDISWARVVIFGLCLLGLVLGVLMVRFPLSPRYVGLDNDGALFAYFGQEILQGSIPYEDIWDTKPPGVFYLSALATWLGGDTPWAIWSFELVWFLLATTMLLLTLNWLSGFIPALAATILITFTALHPLYIRGGNLTEVYAYLPQMLVIIAAVGYFSSGRIWWLGLAGVFTGFAFLLKPTYIALGIALLVVGLLSASKPRDRLTLAGLYFAGFAAPLLLVVTYWGAQGSLDNLVGAVFLENVQYVQAGLSIQSLYGTSRKLLLEQPMATPVVFSLASALLFVELRKPLSIASWSAPKGSMNNNLGRSRDWVLLVIFLAFPLELAFVAISGRNFGHYFITPLPAIAAACSFLFAAVISWPKSRRALGQWFGIVLVLMIGLLSGWFLEVFAEERPTVAQLEEVWREGIGGAYLIDDVEEFVINSTDPTETVLVWGYNPGLHITTGRKAPTPYLFHAQLVSSSPASAARFDRLLQDIAVAPPGLILAQRDSQHAIPHFGIKDTDPCVGCSDEARKNLQRLNSFVDQNYELVDEINGWLIYDHKGASN